MARENTTHKLCDHEDDAYQRQLCRIARRHVECDHEQTPTAQRACDDMAKNHPDCEHSSSISERQKCLRLRTLAVKNARQK